LQEKGLEQILVDSSASTEILDLGVALGHGQAFGIMAGRCTAAQAAAIKRIRDTKAYHRREPAWRDFCTTYLHMSGSQADNIIRAYEKFGDNFFELAQFARISHDSYRAIEPFLKDGALELEGERIELTAENSPRIRGAIADARRRVRENRGAGNIDVLISNFWQRGYDLIDDLRELAPRARKEIRWRDFRGILHHLCCEIASLRADYDLEDPPCTPKPVPSPELRLD
jgi:hypothetical protein